MLASQGLFGKPSTWRIFRESLPTLFFAVHWVTITRLLATIYFTFGRLTQLGSCLVEGRKN